MKLPFTDMRNAASNLRLFSGSRPDQTTQAGRGNPEGNAAPVSAPATEPPSTRTGAGHPRNQTRAFFSRLNHALHFRSRRTAEARAVPDAGPHVRSGVGNTGMDAPEVRNAEVATSPEVRDAHVSASPEVRDAQVDVRPGPLKEVATQYDTKDIEHLSLGNLRRLPEELRLHIASSALDPAGRKRLRLVSKQLSRLGAQALQHIRISNPAHLKSALMTYGPGGIKSLTISGEFKDAHFGNVELQRLIQANLRALNSLDMSGCPEVTFDGVLRLVQHLPSLERLDISGDKQLDAVTGQDMQRLFAMLPELGHLKLRAGIEPDEFNEDDRPAELDEFANAFSSAPNLHHLDLSNSTQLTDDLLAPLLARLPTLQYLNVSRCPWITGAGLAEALQHTPDLKQLDAAFSSNLDDGGLAAALQHVPGLTHLNFSDSTGITPEQLTEALQHVPQLTHLFLANLNDIQDAALAEALQHVPMLRHLDISGWTGLNTTEEGFAAAMRHVRELTHLNVADLGGGITDARLGMAMQSLSGLKSLIVARSSSLTDHGLASALNALPALEYLDISSCHVLTRPALPALPSLNTLNASKCPKLRRIDLANLPALKHLDLGYNPRLTAARLRRLLAPAAPTLEHLNIAHLRDATDENLPRWETFTNLRSLDLSLLDQITDVTIQSLPRGLDYLVVRGCDNLTDAALNGLPKSLNISQY